MKRTVMMLCLGAALCQGAWASSAFETYGDIAQFAIPLAALGISWSKDDYEGMRQLGYSAAATEGTVLILKNTVDATRPNGGAKSFPSGHTALAFSGASYLQLRYGWQYGVPAIIAIIAASAVGWSRVDAKQHYWRDVIAGAAIASGLSYLITTPQQTELALFPTMLPDGATGIGLSYRY